MGEEFAEEDRLMKERIEARNGLEHAAYSVKNQISEEENEDALSEEDRETVEEAVDELIDWLDMNQDADAEEYEEKRDEFMELVQPIMSQLGGGGGGGGFDDEDEDDFDDEDEDDWRDEL